MIPLRRLSVFALALALAPGGCDWLPADLAGTGFTVQVLEPGGAPVAAAHLTGGIDWDYFDVATDSAGEALLPRRARHVAAMIRAENHIAAPVAALEPGSYHLQPTPGRVHLVGGLWGNVVSASGDEATTVSLDGFLRRFAYSDAGVVRTFELRIDTATSINTARVERDTLWLADGNGHLEAWSLANPDQPRKLFALPILVIDWATLDSVRIGGWNTTAVFTYSPAGELRMLATLSLPPLRQAWALDRTHALLVAWAYVGDPATVAVVDATNPRQPRVAFRQDFPGAAYPTALVGNTLVVAHPGTAGDPVVHDRLDLTDPEHPRPLAPLTASAQITAFLSDSVALGTLRVQPGDYGELAFLRRRGDAFETLATAGGGVLSPDGRQVALRPPFLVLGGYGGGGVWKLGW